MKKQDSYGEAAPSKKRLRQSAASPFTNWILSYIRQHRILLVQAIFLGTLTVLFSGALMFTSGYLITKASTRPETILLVYVPIVGVRAFGIGRAAIAYIERLTGHQFILKIVAEMRVRLYKILEPQAILLRSKFQTGDILAALADDIEYLQDFYLKTLLPASVSVFVYAAIILFAGFFSLQFAFVLALLCGLLLFAGPVLSYKFMSKANEQVKEMRNHLYREMTDAVFGLGDWLFSGRKQTFIDMHEQKQEELRKLEWKVRSFSNWRDFLLQFVLGLTVIYAIYQASGMSHDGQIQGTFIAGFGLMMLSLLESFVPVSTAVSEISSYQDSIRRLDGMEEKGIAEWVGVGAAEVQTADVTIELKNLFFQYELGLPLLNGVDMHIRQGEKIAILGPSGAGKTTLLKLVQGALLPKRGEVLLNGKTSAEFKEQIPNLLAVLNQKPYLFNTSVLNNLRLGNSRATDEQVYEAARNVGLHDMLTRLPEGYHTNMNETGQRFSGGERQRIALARILLQNTPVVIMDEPTIGLDPITERNLLADIFRTLGGKTLIWVTHHLAGMEKMDRIVFMDEGQITLSGTHEELLRKSERYKKLFEMDRPKYQ